MDQAIADLADAREKAAAILKEELTKPDDVLARTRLLGVAFRDYLRVRVEKNDVTEILLWKALIDMLNNSDIKAISQHGYHVFKSRFVKLNTTLCFLCDNYPRKSLDIIFWHTNDEYAVSIAHAHIYIDAALPRIIKALGNNITFENAYDISLIGSTPHDYSYTAFNAVIDRVDYQPTMLDLEKVCELFGKEDPLCIRLAELYMKNVQGQDMDEIARICEQLGNVRCKRLIKAHLQRKTCEPINFSHLFKICRLIGKDDSICSERFDEYMRDTGSADIYDAMRLCELFGIEDERSHKIVGRHLLQLHDAEEEAFYEYLKCKKYEKKDSTFAKLLLKSIEDTM